MSEQPKEIYYDKFGAGHIKDNSLITENTSFAADLSEAIARIKTLEAALREAERFVSYLANETDGCFAGSGTPTTCLVMIRAALAPKPHHE